MASTVTATAAPSSVNSGTQVQRTDGGGMGESDFLKLLMSELKNQDPLNPVNDKESMAQLAQFSTLQATQSMQTSLNKVAAGQSMAQGAAMLGKTVQGTLPGVYDAYGKLQPGSKVSGVVTGVSFADGQTTLNIGNQTIPMEYVTAIKSAT